MPDLALSDLSGACLVCRGAKPTEVMIAFAGEHRSKVTYVAVVIDGAKRKLGNYSPGVDLRYNRAR